jgi:hypothetical protein
LTFFAYAMRRKLQISVPAALERAPERLTATPPVRIAAGTRTLCEIRREGEGVTEADHAPPGAFLRHFLARKGGENDANATRFWPETTVEKP